MAAPCGERFDSEGRRRGGVRPWLAYRPTSTEPNGCIEYEYDDGRLMTGCVED